MDLVVVHVDHHPDENPRHHKLADRILNLFEDYSHIFILPAYALTPSEFSHPGIRQYMQPMTEMQGYFHQQDITFIKPHQSTSPHCLEADIFMLKVLANDPVTLVGGSINVCIPDVKYILTGRYPQAHVKYLLGVWSQLCQNYDIDSSIWDRSIQVTIGDHVY